MTGGTKEKDQDDNKRSFVGFDRDSASEDGEKKSISMNEAASYSGARAVISTLLGTTAGGLIAVYRGNPVFLHTALTGFSCTIAATACSVSERAAAVVMSRNSEVVKGDFRTHAIGGILGGSLIGGIYKKSPSSGVLLFTPIMLGVALLEEKAHSYRQNELERIFGQNDKNDS